MDQTASAHQSVFWHQRERRENAISAIAISVYVLVAIIKKRLCVEASLYTILQIFSLMLFEKTPMDQLLNDKALLKLNDENPIPLNLFS